MPYVITEACVDVMDRSCLLQCPVDCIHEGVRMLYIDPGACIDCAACEPSCPQGAIHLDEAIPANLTKYVSVNAEFFGSDEFGPADPRTGCPAGDHPVVAGLAAR
ncbi:MAG: 4Fe-4S binding protein [Pseudonocardia sp.]|uniref:indolepyruvate ferredoxin oxidoreductase subunit alpha n=1 Tax=unclassified Pseudonocardia TaxID=2619320 RepID=UPI00086D470D|nr:MULTISPECIES: ferredoxin family protein [unclassified Pseudonocardia]MBN9108360.1 4Fe-4S binding protein [Pseudonocardia sp.]ODU30339.1 MAG: ferredoxin [Pseudonocardia sp. SCN 72-51]ODV08736.1 MAG: ferredoxin [Pseudonocardia sp. SCN 73-27]